ncbi:hypothetical protein FAES_4670 [Fibrella aestuarina BUZ 2]|uniref:Uncharacterized protein n=1 Tax=Fibrella aestuarina BUZ 2 TaxID=1166018 RepID=I0KEW6_9BACT|nr:hypothetical protein FAES_4670 [Fibrella aestuarina BUZ 2]
MALGRIGANVPDQGQQQPSGTYLVQWQTAIKRPVPWLGYQTGYSKARLTGCFG